MSENTPEPAEAAQPTPDTAPEASAEERDWKAEARKWEQRAKENREAAKELEKQRQASMTEAERTLEAARAEERMKVTERYASRLVDEAFRAATVGRVLSPDALLSFDRKQFITDDGDVDRDGLTKWVEQHAPEQGAPRLPSFDGGARSTAPAPAGMNALIRKAAGRA